MGFDPWTSDDFAHPTREQVTVDTHLRQLRTSDLAAGLGDAKTYRDALWLRYGDTWNWPVALLDTSRPDENAPVDPVVTISPRSFDYALFDSAEERLLGCVHLAAPRRDHGPGREISWWTVVDAPDELRAALDDFVPRWIAEVWQISYPVYPFNALTAEQLSRIQPPADAHAASGSAPAAPDDAIDPFLPAPHLS